MGFVIIILFTNVTHERLIGYEMNKNDISLQETTRRTILWIYGIFSSKDDDQKSSI